MSIGIDVSKYTIDSKAADAILSLRQTLDKVETLTKWLANNPVVEGNDPLITNFAYNADEAYLLRTTFEQLDAIRTANNALFENARKITGLE